MACYAALLTNGLQHWRKDERNCGSLADKKRVKKVGAKEMVQCQNDNYFLGFDINVALTGSQVGCHIARDASTLATNKCNRTLCN